MSWWIPAAMIGLSVLKGEQDKKNYKEQQRMNAEMMRYSPWTGMTPGQAQKPDQLGTTLQAGVSGLAMAQNAAAAQQQQQLLDAQINAWNQMQLNQEAGNPAAMTTMPGPWRTTPVG